MSLNCLPLIFALSIAVDPAEDSSKADVESAQTRESAQRVLDLARQYDFYADAERRTKYVFQQKPLLTYSNPVRGDVYGNVFVWTRQGRPEVVGAIFDYRSERWLDSELHLLSNAATVGVRDGAAFLKPARPGVEFLPVPDAPLPAAGAAARTRQLRDMSRSFTVERDHPEQKKEFLRLLPQPIYRYSSPENDVVDGALFVFVEGTDPEAFLLIEAAGADSPAWRFAFARMNIVEFWGRHNDQLVWHVAPVTWETVFDKQEPYAIVREEPRRGLVRSR